MPHSCLTTSRFLHAFRITSSIPDCSRLLTRGYVVGHSVAAAVGSREVTTGVEAGGDGIVWRGEEKGLLGWAG